MSDTSSARATEGQATVEFAMVAIVLIGLMLAVIDLARAGFTQHSLDNGASTLARSLAAINNVRLSPAAATTPLDPAGTGLSTYYNGGAMTVQAAISQAVTDASNAANKSFGAAALAVPANQCFNYTGAPANGCGGIPSTTYPAAVCPSTTASNCIPTTISNSQVTVQGFQADGATPAALTNPAVIKVTINAPFAPVVGIFLGSKVFHLTAVQAEVTRAGQ